MKNACSGIWYTPPRRLIRSPPNSVSMKSRHWRLKIASGFLISRTVWPWRGNEFMARKGKQEVCYNFCIHWLIFMKLHECIGCSSPITWMWLLWVKVIAPPTDSRKCVTFKMLWDHHLIFIRFASNFTRIMSRHGECRPLKRIVKSQTLLPWQHIKLQYLFWKLLRLLTCFKLHETQCTHQRYQPADMGKTVEMGGEQGLYSATFWQKWGG